MIIWFDIELTYYELEELNKRAIRKAQSHQQYIKELIIDDIVKEEDED